MKQTLPPDHPDYQEAEVLARDMLDARGLVSQISSYLYPEIAVAKDRENAFFTEGGEFAKKIARAADLRMKLAQSRQGKFYARIEKAAQVQP